MMIELDDDLAAHALTALTRYHRQDGSAWSAFLDALTPNEVLALGYLAGKLMEIRHQGGQSPQEPRNTTKRSAK